MIRIQLAGMLAVVAIGCTDAVENTNEAPGTVISLGVFADAQRAARFIQTELWNATTGTLRRRYRQGEAGIDAYAEDYAYLIFGLLELFQADGDPSWLEWALQLQRRPPPRAAV